MEKLEYRIYSGNELILKTISLNHYTIAKKQLNKCGIVNSCMVIELD